VIGALQGGFEATGARMNIRRSARSTEGRNFQALAVRDDQEPGLVASGKILVIRVLATERPLCQVAPTFLLRDRVGS
jgi:hypothetical protein